MNNKTVFVRTAKGEAEANGQTELLFGEAKRIFVLVNNKSNVDELRKHAAPSLRTIIEEVLEQLERDEFIRDKDATSLKKSAGGASGGMAKIAMPKIAVPEKPSLYQEPDTSGGDELDFSSISQAPAQESKPPLPESRPQAPASSGAAAAPGFGDDLDFSSLAQSVTQGSAAEKPKEEAKSKKNGPPEIDFASILAAPGQGGGTDKAQAEAEAKKRAEAEAKARADMEAKKRAEGDAKVRAEMEAKKRAEAEAWARAELETKKKRAEAEAKARAEAEARTRNDMEARIRAEMEARKRVEAEAAAKARMEADARAKAEAAAKARIEAEIKAKADAEARMRLEAEARAKAEAAAKARIEAEARAQAEAAARARIEAEARAKAEAAARARIEAEAKAKAEAATRARLEAEARARAESETRMRLEIEARARAEAEAEARRSAADELDFSEILKLPGAPDNTVADAEAKARIEIEARMRAEEDAKARAQAEQEAKMRAEEQAKARVRAELEAGIRTTPQGMEKLLAVDPRIITGQHAAARSMIATVLFFDVVGYTKQSISKQIELKGQFNSLISGFVGHVDESQRIILDTGDGAAIGFLQHPEDALDVAMKFRAAVTANGHRNYPELIVRAGIHLGPVNVMKDMNGLLNMVGDGINDAQRIMSFAGTDQIYVSRAYFDVISRLTADSARLFKYNGTLKDKHGREHQVYQVLGEGVASPSYAMPDKSGGVESLLQDLSTMLKEAEGSGGQAAGGWKPQDVPGAAQAKSPQELDAEAKRAAQFKAEQAAEAARAKAQQEAEARARAEQEEAARKLAADQAKAFAEAERRAQQQAETEAKTNERDPRLQARRPKAAKAAKPPKEPRQRKPHRPLPLIKVGIALFVLAIGAIIALPYVWPYFWSMQNVVAEVEKELSGQLKQPVHIGSLSTVSLPSPRMDLQDVTVGSKQELTIRHVALHFNVLTLPASAKHIDKAELEDVTISAPSFGGVLPWLQAMGANEHYPLAHVAIHGVHFSGDAPPLPPIGGTMNFDADGKFAKASLSSSDGKITIALQQQEKQLQLDLSLSESSLPLLPKIQFASLEATGVVGDGMVNFSSVTGNMYGGILRGSATLAWKGGWQLQGRMSIGSMQMEKALPGLKVSGDMDGEASFSLSAEKLLQLASAPHLDGSLRIKDGSINSMDLVETARSGQRTLSPGTTHFDQLIATLRTDPSGHHLKPLRISAGAMSMTGSADATPDGRLTGQLLVDLSKVRAGMGSLSLVVNGTVADPAWGIGKR